MPKDDMMVTITKVLKENNTRDWLKLWSEKENTEEFTFQTSASDSPEATLSLRFLGNNDSKEICKWSDLIVDIDWMRSPVM